MKKALYIFLTIICYSNSFGQIIIDSISVYRTENIVDSIYIGGTSKGQVLNRIRISPPYLDACGTRAIILYFDGCNLGQTISYDTIFVLGSSTKKMWISSIWDTIANCSYPIEPFYTDILIWDDNCFAFRPKKLSYEKQLKIYSNSMQNTLKIEGLEAIGFRKIELLELNLQTVIKSYDPNERLLDISVLPPGLSFLKIETDDGYVLTKKVIIE